MEKCEEIKIKTQIQKGLKGGKNVQCTTVETPVVGTTVGG